MAKEYSIGLYEKAMPDNLSWKEKFLAAKEAGYDFVEISIDASEAKISRVYMSKEERLELVKTMYETGKDLRRPYRETAEGGLAKLYEKR